MHKKKLFIERSEYVDHLLKKHEQADIMELPHSLNTQLLIIGNRLFFPILTRK